MAEWRSVKIEDIAAPGKNSLATGPFGSAIGSRFFREEGVPIIRGSNLSLDVGNRLLDGDIAFIDESKADEFPRSVARRGDLVFTCWGTIGQVGLVDSRARFDRYVVSNKQMKLTPDANLIDSLFLYYALASPENVAQVQGMAIGSSVPGFNLAQLRRVEISCPSLPEQKAIAGALGALDDKIAVNERIAETSATLISLLFASEVWDYTARRDRPDVGTEGEIGDLCDTIGNGATPKRGNPDFWQDGRFSWYKTGELTDGPLFDSSERITDQALTESSCKLWPEGTVLIALYGATVGKLGILNGPAAFNQACSALVAKKKFGELILFETLKAIRSQLQNLAVGAAQQNISKAIVAKHRIIVPSVAAADRFNVLARPVHRRQVSALEESRTLATLRDTLLSQLMSGKLRVRDAEKIVEDAA